MSDHLAFTEANIARTLVRPYGMFPPRRYLAVENVSWGLGLPWEADLVVMSGNKFLQEIEIKISLSDLRRDQGKRKHVLRISDTTNGFKTIYTTLMKKFWYAMPEAVWQAAAEKLVPIPPDAGVIIIKLDPGRPERNIAPRLVSEIAVKAKSNPKALPITDKKRYELARLGVLRYWDRVHA